MAQLPESMYLQGNPIGSTNPFNKNVNNQNSPKFQDIKRAVCQIYYPLENGSFESGTGVLVNTVKNTYASNKRTIYIITNDRFAEVVSDTLFLSFNYEMPHDTIVGNNQENRNITKVYKVPFVKKVSNPIADLSLIELEVSEEEINNPKSPLYNAYAIGWELNYYEEFEESGLITIHHPSEDSKKIDLSNNQLSERTKFVNGISSEGDIITQSILGLFPTFPNYFPDYGSVGSPLIDAIDEGLIGIKKSIVTVPNLSIEASYFSAIENSWYKNDENQPGFIHYLDPNYTWMSSIPGGYLKDLISMETIRDSHYIFTPLESDTYTSVTIKNLNLIINEAFIFNNIRREEILGAGIKKKNNNSEDVVYLVLRYENFLIYAVKLGLYNESPNQKPFQGVPLDAEIPFDKSILDIYYNSDEAGFNSSNFKVNLLRFYIYQNQGNPNFRGFIDELNEIRYLDIGISLNASDNKDTHPDIQAIRIPFHMPYNAIELFRTESLQNDWNSKKYPQSKGIQSGDLYIDKITLSQENFEINNILTGNNGGYLNLVNPHYYFETVKTSLLNEEPNKLIFKIDVQNNSGAPYKCKVWMDFFPTVSNNNLYTFDDLEYFGEVEYLNGTTNPNTSNSFQFSFDVPDNFTLGMQPGEERYVRMRVAVCDKNGNLSPQQFYNLGEVEDYMIRLYAPTAIQNLTSTADIYIPIRSGNQVGINNNVCGVPTEPPAPSPSNSPINVGDAVPPYACNSFECVGNNCQTTALNNTSSVSGDYSVCINGSTDFVELDQGSLLLNKAFTARTVSFWLNNTVINGIETVYDEGGDTDGGMGMQINNSTKQLELGVRNGTTLQKIAANLVSTQWVHVVAIFNNGQLSLYQNGTLTAQNNSVGFNSVPLHQEIAAFGGTNGTNVFSNQSTSYNGCADEILIYSKALNAAQVNVLYNNGQIETGSQRKLEKDKKDETNQNTQNLVVYPNPSKGNIHIITEVKQAGALKIQIINLQGAVVFEKKFKNIDEGYQHIALKDLNLSAGTYVISVANNQNIQTKKIIIEK